MNKSILILLFSLLLFGNMDVLAANKTPEPETFPWKVVATKKHGLKVAAGPRFREEFGTINIGDTLIALRPSTVSGWIEILYSRIDTIYGTDDVISFTDTLYAQSKNYTFAVSLAGTPFAEQITRGYVSEETFPRRIVITRPTSLYKKFRGKAKGEDEDRVLNAGDTRYVAIKYTPTIKWLEVMDTTSPGTFYLKTSDVVFGESIAGTTLGEERTEAYAKDKSLWHYLRTHSWPWIILVLLLFFGWGHLLESLLMLIFAIPFGILPSILVTEVTEGEMTGLLLFLCITVSLLGISAVICTMLSENKVVQTICGPIRSVFTPGAISALLLIFAAWEATWDIHTFWGGVLVFALTAIGMFCAGLLLKMAWANFKDGYITVSIVYLYVGVVAGVYLFNASEEACSFAAWCAICGLAPSGFVDSDKYDSWVNGESAKTLSGNTARTSSGKIFKNVKSGWGNDWTRRP